MADLLFELGTEELPARFVVPALDDLEKTFTEQCVALNIKHGAIRRFGTPRSSSAPVEVTTICSSTVTPGSSSSSWATSRRHRSIAA